MVVRPTCQRNRLKEVDRRKYSREEEFDGAKSQLKRRVNGIEQEVVRRGFNEWRLMDLEIGREGNQWVKE